MLRPEELVKNTVYFQLGYIDHELDIPFVEPYFFRGITNFDGRTEYEFESAIPKRNTTLFLVEDGLETMFSLVGVVAELSEL